VSILDALKIVQSLVISYNAISPVRKFSLANILASVYVEKNARIYVSNAYHRTKILMRLFKKQNKMQNM
jgi:hypothetical protein